MRMKVLEKITDTTNDAFKKSVNDDIHKINQFIDLYNSHEDQTQRKVTLKTLYSLYQEVIDKYPGSWIVESQQFSTIIHENLFNQMISESNAIALPLNELTNTNKNHPFAHFISKMPPDKITTFVSILAKGEDFDPDTLKSLYQEDEPGANDYFELLKTHTISFLGGVNSSNFELMNTETGEHWVLKVDPLVQPKGALLRLPKNSSFIVQVDAERQVSVRHHVSEMQRKYNPDLQDRTYALSVTEFCPGGNVFSAREQYLNGEDKHYDALKDSAISIFHQMASVFQQLSENNILFLDAKNLNWLIDANGQIKIADKKSLLPAEAGIYDQPDASSPYNILETYSFSPPEIRNADTPCDIDKAHAYLLGVNLYQYLRGVDQNFLYRTMRQKEQDYSGNFSPCTGYIFTDEKGQALKGIIDGLIKTDPNERMSINEAMQKLQKLMPKVSNDFKAFMQKARDEQKNCIGAEAETNSSYKS